MLQFWALPATAGWDCSIGHAYPEVSELSVENGMLVAALGPYFRETKSVLAADGKLKSRYQYPRVRMTSDGSWQRSSMGSYPDYGKRTPPCIEVPSDPEVAWKSAYGDRPMPAENEHSWFNQYVSGCAVDGDTRWGGISFYSAEGGWGIGGLVRQETKTGTVEYLRFPELRSRSVNKLAHFDGYLWLSVGHNGECGGPAPGSGLKRLKRNSIVEVPEVCGFAIRDFQEFDGALWVATELGLSRRKDGVWTNYIPDMDHPGLLRETTCDDLYTELLTSAEFAKFEGFDIGNAFDIFWERLSVLRPNFTRRYMRELHGHPTDDYPGKVHLMIPRRR